MKRFFIIAAIGAMSLGLAACGDTDGNDQATAEGDAALGTEGDVAAPGDTQTTLVWPQGARIVEEQGVTYRIDPGGTRVRLGPTESRIVVEDDVRFRVDPDGTRVRIDEEGLAVDVDAGDIDASVRTDEPALEVNTR